MKSRKDIVTVQPAYLTAHEHEAIRMAGELSTFITERIISHADPLERADDIRHLEFHVHGIQNMVKGQAAGRLYPKTYRLLGENLPQYQRKRRWWRRTLNWKSDRG